MLWLFLLACASIKGAVKRLHWNTAVSKAFLGFKSGNKKGQHLYFSIMNWLVSSVSLCWKEKACGCLNVECLSQKVPSLCISTCTTSVSENDQIISASTKVMDSKHVWVFGQTMCNVKFPKTAFYMFSSYYYILFKVYFGECRTIKGKVIRQTKQASPGSLHVSVRLNSSDTKRQYI